MPGGGGKGGSSRSTVNVNNGPITIDSDTDADVTINGLDDIGVTLEGGDPIKTETKLEGGDPIKTESLQDFKISEPIVTDNKSALTVEIKPLSVDIKPVALDLCTTVNLGKLPTGIIRQPYHHHIGVTYFGVEYYGVTYSGEAKQVFEELPFRPSVQLPPQSQAKPHSTKPQPKGSGGVKIRIK
ncbi:hypothetical protein [Ruegeria sp. HKCCD8929]|uniref:hypothetical protein n=1 Tax=Ruegeria sp. HKCCD8929 TaxID=2683006 RepID=UPI001488278A|nr:hypothetical protein [Ruegeria sp. HKCCD8929]